jgi:hypothetical protein
VGAQKKDPTDGKCCFFSKGPPEVVLSSPLNELIFPPQVLLSSHPSTTTMSATATTPPVAAADKRDADIDKTDTTKRRADDVEDNTSSFSASSSSSPSSLSSSVVPQNTTTTTTVQTFLSTIELVVYLVIKFMPKFLLEVWGGAGAVWGFSEVCGWRTPDTLYFWRPAALTIGGLFLLRFLGQLCQAAQAYPKGQFQTIETLATPLWDLEVGTPTPAAATAATTATSSNPPHRHYQ